MPQKRKTQSRSKNSKKKISGKKGTRKISGANGAIEPSSGSESSSLDLKRRAISVSDGYRVAVTSGQLSADAQGLSQRDVDDSESVEELVEEGQDLAGELVQGVENAPPADQGDVKTHAPPEPEDHTPAYKNRNRL
jgi:hypothetical protein